MSNPHKSRQTGDDTQSSPVCASKDTIHSPQSSRLVDQSTTQKLLAVDCGLRTGLALYTLSGRLIWYRSHNLGNRQRLKKAVWQILHEIDDLEQLVVEGGGCLADIWLREGEKHGLQVQVVQAEQWRKDLLLSRQQRTGHQAKQVADDLARKIIEHSGTLRPKSLRHDAAEAILVGWWAVQRMQQS